MEILEPETGFFFYAVRPAKLDHTAGESPDGVIAKKPQ
jgi:hypothetical protein